MAAATEESADYYWENGFLVFTRAHHLKRGQCCGNGCRHCPFGFGPARAPRLTLVFSGEANAKPLRELLAANGDRWREEERPGVAGIFLDGEKLEATAEAIRRAIDQLSS